MTVKAIRLFPDAVLSTPCEPVAKSDLRLPNLLQDLWDTLYASPGVGLAAPQIGVGLRVSVIDINHSRKKNSVIKKPEQIVLINPEIISQSGEQVPREGCLSVPDLLANVRRSESVVVRTDTQEGESRLIKGSGFLALALQHEIDHLDGKLFLDRVSSLRTDVFRRKNY